MPTLQHHFPLLLVLLIPAFSNASSWVAGQHYFGANRFVEYIAGDLPIIISVPHGGMRDTSAIPTRPFSDTLGDANTIDLGLACSDSLLEATGGYPHIIICHLKRSKLDVNRPIDTGAVGNALAETAWRQFHAYIDSAKKRVISARGAGCYIDLHGHAHAIQRLELGYLLGPTSLSMSDNLLGMREKYSSVKSLASTTDSSFAKLIRGTGSLGGLMQAAGFPSVPSPQYAGPDTNPYFGGGYDVERHGSRDSGTISGIQIECNFTGVRDRPQNWARFAGAFTRSMQKYFVAHFKMPLPAKVTRLIGRNGASSMGQAADATIGSYHFVTVSGREIPLGVTPSLSVSCGKRDPAAVHISANPRDRLSRERLLRGGSQHQSSVGREK